VQRNKTLYGLSMSSSGPCFPLYLHMRIYLAKKNLMQAATPGLAELRRPFLVSR